MPERTKVDSQLHTVASKELQEEIDAILKKEKDEDSVQYDGGTSDTNDTESQ